MPYGHEMWTGELDDGKYFVIIGCYDKTIKIKMGETEWGAMHNSRVQNIAKINNRYFSLGYLTSPPFDCEIKLILNMLEWKFEEDDIWC